MKKKILLWGLIIVVAISAFGCGSTKSSESVALAQDGVTVTYSKPINDNGIKASTKDERQKASVEVGSAAPSFTGGVKENSSGNQNLVNSSNVSQKVIFTGQVNFETLNFDKTRTELSEYITSIGGYQQNSSIQGGGIGFKGLKTADYSFRVPKSKYNQVFVDLRKFGTVVFEQSSGEDVTDRYFDAEARLKSLKIQQERLQVLLQKATKMEDILKIEKELQTTYYEIENYTGTIKKWDSLVEYSTLMVNIREVEQIKPIEPKEKNGLLARIVFGFKNSVTGLWAFLQDTIVFLASSLPVILPLGLIGYLVFRVVRKKVKKTKVE